MTRPAMRGYGGGSQAPEWNNYRIEPGRSTAVTEEALADLCTVICNMRWPADERGSRRWAEAAFYHRDRWHEERRNVV